tara:strand:- start:824 stop:1501 length:678 start_codon:yes stop_codon:yes gene_type:complete
MSTYTPTHCPETGRKFTKAERKAANKAKYASERVATKPKPKRKPKATKAVKVAKVTLTDEAKLMKMTKAQLVALILFPDVPDPEPTKPYNFSLDYQTSIQPKRKKKPVKASKPAKATKAVKRPKRSSEAGLEQAQARTATANKVGKVKKTKVVHAVTGKEAQPFEPRMEVPVEERKAVKREQMTLTLLPGETPEEGIRRSKIQAASAELEATLLEAEQLTMNFEV